MEVQDRQRGPAKRGMGLAVWILILAAFVAFAVYSGMNVDPSRY
jgi:hypothetical protein